MDKKNPFKERIKLPFKKSHAFIIGINNYLHLPKLQAAVNDAKEFARILKEKQKFNVHPPLLNACRSEIKQLVEKTMPEIVKEEDRCLLFFAGHGIADESKEIPEGYLLPVDSRRDELKGYYAMKDLYAAIHQLKCNHFLLILDCCFSGVFKWSNPFRQIRERIPKCIFAEQFKCYARDPSWVAITSASSDQKAWDQLDGREHSPFAQELFNGLAGAADLIPAEKPDGVITIHELYSYIRNQVETQTIRKKEASRQTPRFFSLEKDDSCFFRKDTQETKNSQTRNLSQQRYGDHSGKN